MARAAAPVTLLPAQQQAFDALLDALQAAPFVTLLGRPGVGKTTVLHEVQRTLGATLLTSRDVLDALLGQHPLAVEEALYRMCCGALAAADVVLVDDVHLLVAFLSFSHSYPRQNFVGAVFTALAEVAGRAGKKLVFAADRHPMAAVFRGKRVDVGSFTPEDYRQLCTAYLGEARVADLDFAQIHRFARKLSAAQIRSTCEALRDAVPLDTDRFTEYLRANHLASNVDLGEVQAVSLSDLKGVDEVIHALEANVVLPLENAELATEFGLKPKRGVLLAGPPGTGKTTVGRALAHRLKSKFFLVDGTVISGTSGFYGRIQQIFEAAKQNAPAIIFIDDSDVIFEEGGEMGLYRYLLTMLDGIESESAGRICLMMTAMDVGSLPPALVRSGRIELWLEMHVPDESARAAILADRCRQLPPPMSGVGVAHLAKATDGLSGADLKRLVEDAKILFAYDRAHDRPSRAALDYFLSALDTVRGNKERYAQAEARARARRPQRPSYFDVISAMAGATVFTSEQAAADGEGTVMGFSLDELDAESDDG